MIKFKNITHPLRWFMTLAVTVLAVGCGNGDPILGGGGAGVTLLNGAQAKNVFWVPTQDATIGVGTTFSGTIVSGRDVTAVTGATINGRILAGAITAGAIALQASIVNVPLP